MSFDCQSCFEQYTHSIIAQECEILYVQHLKEIIDYDVSSKFGWQK